MKNEKNSAIILCIYSFMMLFVCLLASQSLKRVKIENTLSSENIETSVVYDTEIVYIPVYYETCIESEVEDIIEEEISMYTVRAYEGKIGIFSEEEKLLKVLDVYIKTLPKADREMLEKGFYIIGEEELNSIIEDYTGWLL